MADWLAFFGALPEILLAPATGLNALTTLETGGSLFGTVHSSPYDSQTTPEKKRQAKMFLAVEGALLASAAVPALYAYSLRKKRKLKPGEQRLGVSLENASTALQMPLVTALAAPAIAAAAAYITVQKLEEAAFIEKKLGNDVQTLMAVAAAGPMIQGITSIAKSAFMPGK